MYDLSAICYIHIFLLHIRHVPVSSSRKINLNQLSFSWITAVMAKKTFETALAKLEQITDELENGELSLDASLKKFNEGINVLVN